MVPHRITRILIIVIAGLLLAYDVWEGFGNFTGIQQQRLQLGLNLTLLGWLSTALLIFLPVVLFVVTIIVTRTMRLPLLALSFGLTVAVSALISLDIVLAVPVTAIFDAGSAG